MDSTLGRTGYFEGRGADVLRAVGHRRKNEVAAKRTPGCVFRAPSYTRTTWAAPSSCSATRSTHLGAVLPGDLTHPGSDRPLCPVNSGRMEDQGATPKEEAD